MMRSTCYKEWKSWDSQTVLLSYGYYYNNTTVIIIIIVIHAFSLWGLDSVANFEMQTQQN